MRQQVVLFLAFFCFSASAETKPVFSGCDGIESPAVSVPRLFWVHERIYSYLHLAQMEFRKTFSGPPLFGMKVGNGVGEWGNEISEIAHSGRYDFESNSYLEIRGDSIFSVKNKKIIDGTAFGWGGEEPLECDIVISDNMDDHSKLLVVLHELLHALGLRHTEAGIMKSGFDAGDIEKLKEWPLVRGLSSSERKSLECAYGVVLTGEAIVATTNYLY